MAIYNWVKFVFLHRHFLSFFANDIGSFITPKNMTMSAHTHLNTYHLYKYD